MENDRIDWDFCALNDTDFLLTFNMTASKPMFDMILSKALYKLRRMGKQVDTKAVEAFEIEERYYNLLHTILNKQIKEVSNNVKEDNIVMMNSRVEYAKFSRQPSNTGWDILIKVGGMYGRK